MDVEEIIKTLTPLERRVLPLLKKNNNFNSLVNASNLSETEVNRSLLWLQNKNLIKISEEVKESVVVGRNGEEYLKDGLPERRVLNVLSERNLSLRELTDHACLDEDELRVSLGILRKKDAIEIKDNVRLKDTGKKLLNLEFEEEKFLKKLPLNVKELDNKEIAVLSELKKRKNIIKIENLKTKTVYLTEFGRSILEKGLREDLLEGLTIDLLKSGKWKGKEFRHYNITSITPKIYGGRIHPQSLVIDKIKKIFLNLGFKEMKSPWVDTCFWCMDSMWIPQDHPSREVQDTFFLPYKGDIPNELSKKVADVHEHGGKTGSKGYGYKWNPEIAKQLILRTHTTATTYRYFHQKNIEYPAKYFSIGRVFRNESIDQTHLAEFHQVEGFVMDEDLTLRDLMGYIKEFYSKMGIYKIKFKPVYNPYTEPSMEAYGYNEQLGKWIELINSGVFRPESLEPYGINVPVIAWGLSVERLAMMLYKQKDIREVFGTLNDLNFLRTYNAKW
ncbi:phenylalanine--tRNA ligase subunit alpha [Candidatus Woesearchaeota archaeon]|nr:phenylalanine--tRNA ligase subunit alpha [Candidatus Woesearchaeota archaeon]